MILEFLVEQYAIKMDIIKFQLLLTSKAPKFSNPKYE